MQEPHPVVGCVGAHAETRQKSGDKNVVAHIHAELRGGLALQPFGGLVGGWANGLRMRRGPVPQILQHVGHVPLAAHHVLHGIRVFVVESSNAQWFCVSHDWERDPHALGEMVRGEAAASHRAGVKTNVAEAGEVAARLARHLDAARGQAEVASELLVICPYFGTLRVSDEKRDPLALVKQGADSVKIDGVEAVGKADGVFRRFNLSPDPVGQVRLKLEPVQPAGPVRAIPIGQAKVAEAPGDADFVQAAVWRVKLPENLDPNRELLLRVHYIGDAARVYLDGRLLTDDFYNGNSFDIGLKRYAPGIQHQELLVKILPLQQAAPIYLAADAWPDFAGDKCVGALSGIDVLEMQTVELE